MPELDLTHDPARRSWLASANVEGCAFPIQNLPLGIFRPARDDGPPRGGVAIGDRIVDLAALAGLGLLGGKAAEAARAASAPSLNELAALGPSYSKALRHALSELLDGGREKDSRGPLEALMLPQSAAELLLPIRVGGFTDFFASEYHAARAGRVSRPDRPVPSAFYHMPMGYNGQASSVRVSGTPLRRPKGQHHGEDGSLSFGPSRQMDFELELGAVAGMATTFGMPPGLDESRQHIFGYCLVNDWSARDIQRCESFPLGPFLSKSMMTSISPWIVTREALAPFGHPLPTRAGRPPVPEYLRFHDHEARGGLDIDLQAAILTKRMRTSGGQPHIIVETNAKHLYWSFAQMLTHHTSNGSQMLPGDLLGSGTVSGPEPSASACMFERTLHPDRNGREPLSMPNGEARMWLEDDDEIILTGTARREGFVPIGFGECRTILRAAVGEAAPTQRATASDRQG